ncbi:MAG: peptidase [Porphyrobacter sp.]|nr:peptidase [Porphyrobacter sp.]
MNALIRCTFAFVLLFMALPTGLAAEPRPLDEAARTQVIDGIIERMRETYVFPDIAAAAEESLRAAQRRGDYAAISDPAAFADRLTADLRAVTHDKHLGVAYSEKPLPPLGEARERDPAALAQWRTSMAQRNFAIPKAEVLAGNIGYVKLNNFLPARFAGDTFAAAMGFLRNTDGLIIDLRENGGGDPEMVAFVLSYLVPSATHINDFYYRPDGSTRQVWSLPVVPGGPYDTDKPLFVLTGTATFSAAEEFAYDVQQLKRGTVIGEVTGGGANPGMAVALDEHFSVFIPVGRAINPVSKTNWEGVGVIPDVAVDTEKALDVAHRMALEALLADTTDPDRREDIVEALARISASR